MTPFKSFEILQKIKDKEEMIKFLRQNRPTKECVCDKCDKRRRCN